MQNINNYKSRARRNPCFFAIYSKSTFRIINEQVIFENPTRVVKRNEVVERR